MTISERINLHRCGYSRAEIDALAAAEKEEAAAAAAEKEAEPAAAAAAEKEAEPVAADPVDSTEPPKDPALDRSGDILAAINNLTAAIQARNVNTEQQPIAEQTTITDIIKNI